MPQKHHVITVDADTRAMLDAARVSYATQYGKVVSLTKMVRVLIEAGMEALKLIQQKGK